MFFLFLCVTVEDIMRHFTNMRTDHFKLKNAVKDDTEWVWCSQGPDAPPASEGARILVLGPLLQAPYFQDRHVRKGKHLQAEFVDFTSFINISIFHNR